MPSLFAGSTSTSPTLAVPRRALRWLAQYGWLENAVIVLITFFALTAWLASFSRIVPTFHNGWAIYWPFDGIIIAFLLMTRRRRWPWILAGFALTFVRSEFSAHEPWAEVTVDVLCNIGEILVGACFLPPFRSLQQWLLERRLISRFITFAVVLGPGLFALPVSAYFITRYPGTFWRNYNDWAFADALGAALWIPMVLVLFSRETYLLFRWRKLPETLFLFSLLGGVTWFAFHQNRYPLSFLPYPILLFVSLRLRFSGAVFGANILALVVASISLRDVGPFHMDAQALDTPFALIVQVYCTLGLLLVFPLSITLVERRNLEHQLRLALSEVQQQAVTDKLTGLANRRQFDTIFDVEWRRAVRPRTPVALLMIDVDCFKAYNDHYGHVAGDECLRQVASLLATGAHRHHDLIARYGGEEFSILLPGASAEFALEFAERTRATIAAAAIPHIKNPHHHITVSIGCASVVPSRHVPQEDLIAAADRALYAAKHAGRNRVELAAAVTAELVPV